MTMRTMLIDGTRDGGDFVTPIHPPHRPYIRRQISLVKERINVLLVRLIYIAARIESPVFVCYD